VTLQHIIAALRAAPSIRQWQITEVVTVRHERYLTFLVVESERRAAATRWVVWLALAAHDGKQGEASFTLGSAEDADALVERMRQALDSAAAAGNPAWELPVPGAPGTAEAPSDPAAACDSGLLSDPVHVLDELVAEYTAAVPAEVRPSTLELFATITDRRLLNHRGLDLRDRSTRLYAEFVLLHRPAHGAEVEFFDRVEATRASDLHLGARVAIAAACVRDGASAGKPVAGVQAVLISDAYAAELIDYYAHHSDAALHARRVNVLHEQAPVLVRQGGDPLTLSSDPGVPSLAAYSFDANGYAAQRQELVVNDVLVGIHGSGRWMQVLGRTPRGARGTQVVPAGGTPLAELRSGVLEVVRFSEFSPRADTGAFSGEIRLAYLHLADGTRRAICGGSVSGVLKDALADARFSREVVTVGDYHGPQAIRLAAVTITA
jgi:predicted Zn-dependent protease